MKKKNIIIISVVSLVVVAALTVTLFFVLGNKKEDTYDRFSVYGAKDATSYKTIKYEKYEELIENDESFVLYIYSIWCSSCTEFRPRLDEVIRKNELQVYALKTQDIPSGTIPWKYTPSIVIYKEGEIESIIDESKDKKAFSSIDNFQKYLDKYIFMPKMLHVDEYKLNNLIEKDKSFIVYYSWSKSEYAKHFEKKVLPTFLKNEEPSKNLLIIKVDQWLDEENTTESEEWQQFAASHFLKGETYGYLDGSLPTLQLYENGELTSSMIFFGGELSNEGEQLKVIDTYYNDDTSLNKLYNSKEEYILDTSSFFESKFNEFMNDNLTKIK